jgi:hypothetical protein
MIGAPSRRKVLYHGILLGPADPLRLIARTGILLLLEPEAVGRVVIASDLVLWRANSSRLAQHGPAPDQLSRAPSETQRRIMSITGRERGAPSRGMRFATMFVPSSLRRR